MLLEELLQQINESSLFTSIESSEGTMNLYKNPKIADIMGFLGYNESDGVKMITGFISDKGDVYLMGSNDGYREHEDEGIVGDMEDACGDRVYEITGFVKKIGGGKKPSIEIEPVKHFQTKGVTRVVEKSKWINVMFSSHSVEKEEGTDDYDEEDEDEMEEFGMSNASDDFEREDGGFITNSPKQKIPFPVDRALKKYRTGD